MGPFSDREVPLSKVPLYTINMCWGSMHNIIHDSHLLPQVHLELPPLLV